MLSVCVYGQTMPCHHTDTIFMVSSQAPQALTISASISGLCTQNIELGGSLSTSPVLSCMCNQNQRSSEKEVSSLKSLVKSELFLLI